MTANQYVVWFIGMAVLITAILAIGILEAASLMPHPRWRHRAADTEQVDPGQPDSEVVEHHHWYDRFHHRHAA